MSFFEAWEKLGISGSLRVLFILALLATIGYSQMRCFRPFNYKQPPIVYLLTAIISAIALWLMVEPISWLLEAIGTCWCIVVVVIFLLIGSVLEDEF